VALSQKHGYVKVNGFNLFYETFGSGNEVLLCLHGGPGAPHDYLLPLGKLGDEHIRVVMYDQLGVGRSEKPTDTSNFSIEYGAEEVEGLRRALDLGKVNLFGSSYGGALALQYALKYQQNVKTLIVAGGLACVQEAVVEMNRLKASLPRDVRETMAKYEEKWAYLHPEYLKAVEVFYRNFFCRRYPWPEEVTRTLNETSIPVYFSMWGPNEFTAIGTWKDWDIRQKIREINVPTLITVGRYDEVTPTVAKTIHEGIRDSKLLIFENSGHLTMWDEEDSYLKAVKDFIMK
jgi:proline iminopeptidase